MGKRGPGDVERAHELRFFRSALAHKGAEDRQRRRTQDVGTKKKPSGVPSGFRMPSIGSSKLFFAEKELAFKNAISLMAKGEYESGREPLRGPPGIPGGRAPSLPESVVTYAPRLLTAALRYRPSRWLHIPLDPSPFHHSLIILQGAA